MHSPATTTSAAVVPSREAKSIGAEETFGTDLHDRAECDRELVRLADRVTVRLRRSQLTARTITVKIRFADFRTITRSRTLDLPSDISTVVLATARDLLGGVDVAPGIRLLGISLSQLDDPGVVQGVLDLTGEPEGHTRRPDAGAGERRAAVERAVDAVRDRFGDTAVRPAALADDGPARSK